MLLGYVFMPDVRPTVLKIGPGPADTQRSTFVRCVAGAGGTDTLPKRGPTDDPKQATECRNP
jgi:hypothetical protein